MKQKITTLIVDDDAAAIQKLSGDLAAFPEIDIIGTCLSAEKAKCTILKEQPDLLFLDIEMPGGSGIELLKEVKNDIHANMRIVFYTAYDKYLLDAIRASVFDYLLKPYLPEELTAIIRRYHTSPSRTSDKMEQSLMKLLHHNQKYAIQTITGLLLVRSKEVLLFQFIKEVRCWQMVLTNHRTHKLRMSTTAKEILEIDRLFAQISQDCIINLNYLMFIENKTLACKFYPPFEKEERIVSHRYYKKLKDKLEII